MSVTIIEGLPSPKTWVEAMYEASNAAIPEGWVVIDEIGPVPSVEAIQAVRRRVAIINADPVDLEPIARAVEALGITIVEATEAAALLTSTRPSQEIALAKISDALFSAHDLTAELPPRRKPKHRGPKPHGRWWDR